MATIHARAFPTPFGPMTAVADVDGSLVQLLFPGAKVVPGPGESVEWDSGLCSGAIGQVGAYLRGELRDFDLTLAPRGTPFQLRVWEELRAIPFGRTISYGELARRIGRPSASRAVGRANATNPIPLVVPCHRVVGSNGTLTGFAGGLDLKRRLLELEAVGAPAGLLF